MVGLASVAQPLILLVLKEKWEFSAVLLQIICLSMMWYPVHSINLNLLQVKGRSDLFLKLEIWKKCVGVAIICVTVPFGLVAMCWGSVVNSLIALVINTHYTGNLIQVGFLTQIRDLLPTIAYSLSMGGVVLLVVSMLTGLWLQLTVGVISGIIFFLIITKATNSRDLRELISFIREARR